MSSINGGAEPPGQQRSEFVRSFVEYSWTRPGTERPAARPHVLLTVATLAAAVALGVGVVLQLIWPVTLAVAPPAAPSATGAGFTAVAGWDCTGSATSGFEATGRQASWYTIAEGGWAQDGCHGSFEVMPMTADESDRRSQSAVWWFVPPAATRCTLMVFIPAERKPTYRTASSAQFYVLAGRSGQRFGQFVVDQSTRLGSWVEVGTYPTTSSGVAVLLVSQGQPPSPDTMLAIAQVKAVCAG